MADEIALGPQANFNIIATEILKIPNTPALAGGQQLLAELRAIREQSTRDTMAIRQDIANIRQEIVDVRQELVTIITASNHNNAARVQNTYLRSQNENLVSFLNATTGAAILDFPRTSSELERMARRQLDSVLQQLGIPTQGANLADKKRLLRAHIGLPEVAGSPPP
ncbi:uncharacterized protein Z520_01029 [Fonsecaea multimorphosa CBS 102226]|uniref:Uncharacterized protein n=1 Tax=Fonsecaea multimorphosa CBS 102226 TaxID=1442371 RepID=A0A0D2L0L0_9EURO|nr:uncharacterized protein Z520_01029 [Fonsecaea multimorphosa CBS 102226]KIY02564.1 hypothetical protein Z520_01029 [Fonsecaea multimorphosa CBS 102226]OAL31430.1 hypothetical protein AYO22_01022 [Fonsecaea multimorphosa]